MDLEKICQANTLATEGLTPDVTILLDLEPGLALSRVSDLEEGDRIGGHLQLGLDLGDPLSGKRKGGWEIDVHRKVRAGFLQMTKKEPNRWLVIDGTKSASEISELVWKRVEPYLSSLD
jgi:dTMP kinase